LSNELTSAVKQLAQRASMTALLLWVASFFAVAHAQQPSTPSSAAQGTSIQLQALPPPLPQLQLSAEAATNLRTDELTVRLASERQGASVSALNGDVLRQLNAALEQARRVEGAEARMSSIQTNPDWDNAGKRKGWRVRGEVELKSKNVAELAELAGKLSETMQLAGVDYSVSPELMQKTRESLIASAAESFKRKADIAVRALGFSSYEVIQVSLMDGVQSQPPVAFKSRDGSMVAMAESAVLPAVGGTERVAVTFSGAVALKR